VAYAFSDKMKIIDFRWLWRSVLQQELFGLYRVFPSDCWVFCYCLLYR